MKKALIIGTLTFLVLLIVGCSDNITGNAVADNKGQITIPLSEVSTTAKFYTFNDKGININYFTVLGSDGKPRTAFDACDVCGGSKGYSQRGNDMVCNNCGRFFSIDDIGTKNGPGGCWPSFLEHKIEGDNIIIKKSNLAKGASRFR
jgi:uncharacterized membrane protein